MAGSSVQHFHVHVGARAEREAVEKIMDELGLQIADTRDADLEVDDCVRPPSEIDRGNRKRLVHRHDEIAGAVDAPPRAHSFGNSLAERNPEILHGVMLIDVEIAVGFDPEIERPMTRDELEHVIQKPDARANDVSPLAFETEAHGDPCFLRSSIDYRAAHRISSIATMKRRVCSTMPVAMRQQPAQPGSDERSRM